jgi:hypothetical protein
MDVYDKINKKKVKMDLDLIIENLYYDKIEIINNKDKDVISELEGKIPLYDIYTSNLYLINPENLFRRITYNHYRFPSQKVLDELEKEINKLKSKDDLVSEYKVKKFKLMKQFLSNFNLKLLEDSFYRIMYTASPELGRNLLFCKRPSFNKYIHNSKPYYTKTEIVNMARNMGLEINIKDLSTKKIDELCEYVKDNDINSNILLSHQKHIIDSDMLGLVQYYTVQGSANLNSYLRNPSFSLYENEIYNTIIKKMWNLCTSSPVFDKDYVVYRFIKEDSFLEGIKVGQIFLDKSFQSTTRDPFYRSDTYSFGFILMKVHIPKNKKGVALCLETCSHFPEEQEIIFPPGSRFKLIAKDSDITYYHTDLNFTSKVKTKYEFEWVGVEEPTIDNVRKEKFTNVKFIDTQLDKSLSLPERIKRFTLNLNNISQFEINIGSKIFTVISEKYNSIGAYKNFYGIKTENGFSLYCIYDNYLLFFIEIGTVNNIEELHFNYYVRYNTLNKEKIVSPTEMIDFIAAIAYYFALDRVIIYSEYKPCFSFNVNKQQRLENTEETLDKKDINDLSELTGNYCEDFYLYLKNNKKRFFDENINEIELSSGFSFYDLDYLKTTNTSTFFTKEDDELYQIYEKSYKLENKKSMLSDYFIWIIENKCYLVDKFIKKIGKLYDKINPFKRDMYILSHQTYLYNRGKVSAFYSYYNFEITDRENNLIRTDEFKRLNSMNRDLI